jgi:hypothetical protein
MAQVIFAMENLQKVRESEGNVLRNGSIAYQRGYGGGGAAEQDQNDDGNDCHANPDQITIAPASLLFFLLDDLLFDQHQTAFGVIGHVG